MDRTVQAVGRIEEMGDSFASEYGMSYGLRSEQGEGVLYALIADDEQTGGRIRDHSGLRAWVTGTLLDEVAEEQRAVRLSVTAVDPA